MSYPNIANLAYSTVAVAPSPATSGTTLTVANGNGALFPTTNFCLTAYPPGVNPLASNAEILFCTSRTGDVFTITRAQEGTSAKSIATGWQIANTATVLIFTEIENAIASSGGSAAWGGITGTLSSQTDLQTALNAKIDTSAIGSTVQAWDQALQDLSAISFVQGDVLYFNGTNLVKLSPGTSGQALITQGAGANPKWDTVAAGSATWGAITGTLSAQTDLQTALNAKLTAASNLSDLTNVPTARTNLGLAIGTNVQAQDASLQDLANAALVQGDILYQDATNLVRLPAGTNGQFLKTQGAGANPTWAAAGSGDLLAANNLNDVASKPTSFANIKQDATTSATGVAELATVAESGTGTDTTRIVTPAGIFPAEVDIASGSTTNIGGAASLLVRITGNATITAFDTVASGIRRQGRFSGSLTLTHNASSLILPGGVNIITAAGDTFSAFSLGSGNWVVSAYQRASGIAVATSNALSWDSVITKVSDDTSVNSTTLIGDSELIYALAANSFYLVQLQLLYSASNLANDYQGGFQYPSINGVLSPIGTINCYSLAGTAQILPISGNDTNFPNSAPAAQPMGTFIVNAFHNATVQFALKTLGTAGNLQWIFSSFAAGGGNAITKAGSTLFIKKMA